MKKTFVIFRSDLDKSDIMAGIVTKKTEDGVYVKSACKDLSLGEGCLAPVSGFIKERRILTSTTDPDLARRTMCTFLLTRRQLLDSITGLHEAYERSVKTIVSSLNALSKE